MYNEFRTELANALFDIKGINVDEILRVVDGVSGNYEFSRKENQIIPYMDELPDTAKMFLVCKKIQGYSNQTTGNYKLLLCNFFRDIGKLPSDITSTDIRIWLYRYQTERNVSARTINKYRESLLSFFSWAMSEGYIEKNPMINVGKIKYESKQRQSLNDMQLEMVRESCRTLREKAVIEFLFSTGARVSELSVVKITDVDWDRKTVNLFGKGKKHRTSYLNARAIVALQKYLNSRTDEDEHLIVSSKRPYVGATKRQIEYMFKDISNRAFGLDSDIEFTPHVLRHTTATMALQRGMPVEDIQRLLGHSNINTTMIYAQTCDRKVQEEHIKYVV